MRLLSTLWLVCFFLNAGAQENMVVQSIAKQLEGRMGCGMVNAGNQPDSPRVKIRLRCGSSLETTEPLVVIDGIPEEMEALRGLDPHDIESLTILKSVNTVAIYGQKAINGVILVTTKKEIIRKFSVKDLLDKQPLAGAVFTFSNTEHTIMAVADKNGSVKTNELKKGKDYKITVSMVGYKELVSSVSSRFAGKEFLLERDNKVCEEVILTSLVTTRCWRCRCCVGVLKTYADGFVNEKPIPAQVKVYPNPVQRGNTVTAELKINAGNAFQVNVLGMDGRMMLSQKNLRNTELFRIQTDNRWPAGIYIIQVMDENKKLLQAGKIVIQ